MRGHLTPGAGGGEIQGWFAGSRLGMFGGV